MKIEIVIAVLLPFIGTALGAAFVFFLRGRMDQKLQWGLSGFASGVMTAASIWSLIIPAIEQSAHMGALAFLPAFAGIWGGFLFLLILDHIIPHLEVRRPCPESSTRPLGGSAMIVLSVTLHNLPEGMAVGVAAAGLLPGNGGISAAAVLTLALGIALQNLPEGAIISMPLKSCGMGTIPSFVYGVMSGVVEPIGAVATILLAELAVPVLPWLLSFSAGAMLYVVVGELVPGMQEEGRSDVGVLLFAAGFTLMMAMDVALG